MRRCSMLSLCFTIILAFTVLGASRAQAQTYTETVLTSFPTGGPSQAYFGTLIQASDGNFYGTTRAGGTSNLGTVFKVTSAGALTVLHSFAGGAADGANPWCGLIEATDGNFYGTTFAGGTTNNGTAYKMTPAGVVTVLHSFTGSATDGADPVGPLMQATDGNFYGTAKFGGSAAGSDGVAFQILGTSPYTFTVVHNFLGMPTDGYEPYAGFVEGTDGYLYGSTAFGGTTSNYGTVYRMLPSGSSYSLLQTFNPTTNSDEPFGTIIQGADGNFYGTLSTSSTGNTAGSMYKFTLGNTPAFTQYPISSTIGGDLQNSLVEGTDGLFYGGALRGSSNAGSVYSVTSGGTFHVVHAFTGTPDGQAGYGGLVQGSDGAFYGATDMGGNANLGVVYKIVSSAAPPAPVELTSSAPTVVGGTQFSLTYEVKNSYNGTVPGTMNYCFATNNAGDTTGWAGTLTGEPTTQSKTVTAPTAAGTYTYALTCGGKESGFATVNVTAPPSVLTFTSVTHNFGSEVVGTAASSYGISVKNTSTTSAYPYSLVFTPAHGFTSATNCPSSIAIGASCELVFYFTPTATGTVTANWSLTPDSSFNYTPSNGGTLTGTGTSAGAVTLTTNGHNFGTQTVGTTSAAYGTELMNSTSSAETLTLGPVPSGPFSMLTNCGTQLAAGANCEIEFTFTPTSNSPVSVVVPLSGTPTAITSGGAALPSGGITLSGN